MDASDAAKEAFSDVDDLHAASDPKEVKWYDTDHFFNDEARKDRMDWLARVLGL